LAGGTLVAIESPSAEIAAERILDHLLVTISTMKATIAAQKPTYSAARMMEFAAINQAPYSVSTATTVNAPTKTETSNLSRMARRLHLHGVMNQQPDQPNWDKTQQNSMKWSEDRGEKVAAKPKPVRKAKRTAKKR